MVKKQKLNKGFCACGCGRKTKKSKINRKERGWIKGQPIKFIVNHRHKILLEDLYIINKEGCWIWTGYIANNGYGKIGLSHGETLAHRYVFKIFKGKIPKNKELDHKCRVRNCVNPEHLRIVTRLVNSRCGAKTKINIEIAKEIYNLKNIMYYKDVCKKYKIGKTLVHNIWNKKAWLK